MASYKVSYKILHQQGENLKAVAKLTDGYSERVAQVSAKLGEGELLSEVRTNLGKLREQMGESRMILQIAGEFLTKTVESYTGVEIRQVKKADGTRAHQRDFYKNPVVVASAGGAGVAAAMPASAPAQPSVTYVDNSVNVNYVAVEAAPVAAPVEVAAPVAASAPAPAPVSAPAFTAAPVAAAAANVGTSGAGIAAGAGVLGGALGAGAVIGVKHLMDQDKKTKAEAAEKDAQAASQDEYDPEAELAKALQRVKDLEEDDA